MELTKKLTPAEEASRRRCEQTIRQTKGAFIACGTALAEIRDDQLYRNTHKTFETYCQEIHGFNAQRARQIIAAAQIVEALPAPARSLVKTERAARALGKIPESVRPAVIESLKNGAVTSDKIVCKQRAIGTKVPILDKTGYPVPDPAMSFWLRSEEVETIAREISKARSFVRAIEADNDPMFSEVNVNSVLADLNNAYNAFKQAIPFAVCPTCQGQTPKKCTLCKGRGVISKFRWDTAVPEELKAIRAKANAK